MAVINWGLPTETSLYTDVLDYIDLRLKDAAMQFPTTNTYTNLPTNTISFRSNKWQYWNGASWIDLRNYSAATPEYYDIGILGTAINIRGVAAAVNGGTGKSSYVVGDLLTASSTTALSAIAAPIYGKVLLSQGSSTAAMPVWGSVNLQDHVTSILNVANGGTGVTTLSGLVKANGTSAFTAAVEGTDYAAAVHTHSYLSLAGGTITGGLTNTTTTTNSLTQAGDIGGSYASWNTTRSACIQLDAPTNTSAYMVWRVTKQGERHIGAMEAYAGGTSSSVPTVTMHVGTTTNGFTFQQGGNFSCTGAIVATGNVTAYSDLRLKTKVKTIENALDKTCKLRGVSFDKDGQSNIGVIAQEVEQVIPEVVRNNEEYKSVAYGNIVGLLIEAIKELNAKVERLENDR